MLVSHRHRLVFVQVPQTGCTAVGEWMTEHLDAVSVLRKHSTLSQAKRVLGSEIDGYLVVASVRDSLDQFVSSFHKLERAPIRGKSAGWPRANTAARARWASEGERTLDDYIDRWVRRVHAPVYVLSLRECDVVIRYERLQEDVAQLSERIGAGRLPEVPTVNETDRVRRDLSDLVSAKNYARVERLHRAYRHEFGYTTTPPRRTDRIRYEALIRAKDLERHKQDDALRRLHAGQ